MLRGFGSRLGFRELAEMLPNKLGVLEINRTGVRLLLGNAGLRQILDQYLSLDLELACQLVDSDLMRFRHFSTFRFIFPRHCLFGTSRFFGCRFFGGFLCASVRRLFLHRFDGFRGSLFDNSL